MDDQLLQPPISGLTNRYVDPRHPLTQELAGVLRALKGPGDALRGAYGTTPEVAGQWSDRDDAREAANSERMQQDANSATLLALTGGLPGAQAGALGALGGKRLPPGWKTIEGAKSTLPDKVQMPVFNSSGKYTHAVTVPRDLSLPEGHKLVQNKGEFKVSESGDETFPGDWHVADASGKYAGGRSYVSPENSLHDFLNKDPELGYAKNNPYSPDIRTMFPAPEPPREISSIFDKINEQRVREGRADYRFHNLGREELQYELDKALERGHVTNDEYDKLYDWSDKVKNE